MANSRTSSAAGKYEEASVDTDPGASGYGCNAVSHEDTYRAGSRDKIFYISSIGTGATVTLQWKRDTDSTWTDYATYTSVTRQVIQEKSFNIQWRGVVQDNDQGSAGASVFGICW